MSIIGLDFGSHSLSIALYYEDKDIVEVIADDIGSRTIPCCVAFRSDEILTGQSAIAQQHKNLPNTFTDIRSRLLDSSQAETLINVPALEKEISVLELSSHFFRNVHNQVKQQVGKIVRNCVISLPEICDDAARDRIVKSAQEGGLRVKSIIHDPLAVMLAYQIDDKSIKAAKVIVVDMGYSKTEIAIFDVRCGVFYALGRKCYTSACGKDMVRLVSEHCAKDFQRRSKIPCVDNTRAMMRLRRECETAIKSLSTGQEAPVDLDSLCEGVDYSSKLSRARFEDLCATTFVALRLAVEETLALVPGLSAGDVTHVCLAGGMTSVPKVQATLRAIFPAATLPSSRSRIDPAEIPCVGAAQFARTLVKNKLVDAPPASSPTELRSLSRSLWLREFASGESAPNATPQLLLPSGSLLPVKATSKYTVLVQPGCSASALQLVGDATPSALSTTDGNTKQQGEVVLLGQISLKVEVTAADGTGAAVEAVSATDPVQVEVDVEVEITMTGSVSVSVSTGTKEKLHVTGSLTIASA